MAVMVDVSTVNGVDMPVLVEHVAARYPDAVAVHPGPMTGHPVIMARVVPGLEIVVTMMPVTAVMERRVSAAEAEAADADLDSTGIRRGRADRHQTENSHTCDCETFHD